MIDWLKHDDDLRYVNRVLSGATCATEEDKRAAMAIIHGLRTLVRAEYDGEAGLRAAAEALHELVGMRQTQWQSFGGRTFDPLAPAAREWDAAWQRARAASDALKPKPETNVHPTERPGKFPDAADSGSGSRGGQDAFDAWRQA